MAAAVLDTPSVFPQGQPVAVYAGGATGQPQVYFQAVTGPPPPPSKDIRLRKSHMTLGIVQMAAGGICFVLEVIGLAVGSREALFGVGIWAGVFFILAGMLGFLAARRNSKCLLVACMVMNIIGACVAVIGLSMSSVEMINHAYYTYRYRGQGIFQRVKGGFNIAICLLELVVTIVHASFTCASCCLCCLPGWYGGWSSQTSNGPAIVVLQQPGHGSPYAAPMHMQCQSVANPAFVVNAGANTSAAPLPVKSQPPSAVGGEDRSGPNRDSLPPSYSETEIDGLRGFSATKPKLQD